MSRATPDEVVVAEERRSWVPMVGLFLAQVLMSFNVAALPVSLGSVTCVTRASSSVSGSGGSSSSASWSRRSPRRRS